MLTLRPDLLTPCSFKPQSFLDLHPPLAIRRGIEERVREPHDAVTKPDLALVPASLADDLVKSENVSA